MLGKKNDHFIARGQGVVESRHEHIARAKQSYGVAKPCKGETLRWLSMNVIITGEVPECGSDCFHFIGSSVVVFRLRWSR